MKNNKLLFKTVAEYFEKIENTSSRNEKTKYLSELFEVANRDEIDILIYLSLGRISPMYEKTDFNIGVKTIINIYSKVASIESKDVKSKYQEIGDIGEVFESIYRNSVGDPLSINNVFNILKKITQIKGKDSVDNKSNVLIDLYKKITPIEGKYISRIVVGDLRLGFSDKTILDAISFVLNGNKKDRKLIEKLYFQCSDLGMVAKISIFEKDLIDKVYIIPGIPLFAKLVDRPKSLGDIFNRFKKVFVQPKYDGMRCQIHIFQGKVKLFSRNLDDITEMYPDIVNLFGEFPVNTAILDSEIIGVDSDNKFLTFQNTSQRKRKYNIDQKVADIPVNIFIFDLIYLNGESFINISLDKRLEKLKDVFQYINIKNLFISETKLVSDIDTLNKIFRKYIELGFEGVVVKNPHSLYTPGVRNVDWLKIKKDSYVGIVDTIDAVIIGYYYGRGVRSKFGIGAVLAGIYNKKEDRFESICKIGTGFKDNDLVFLKKKLDEIKSDEVPDQYFVNKNLYPDVWVEPKYVIVVKSDEISRSKVHTAGINKKNTIGYALRFPRFINFRDDKGIYDITSLSEIEIYGEKWK
ncbi:ATP-dependent DNA ligase [Patescibacteria group bacterium]|nr:ATP-dependent DNA ligase [Patescibacteria group bacterium]